MNSYDILVDAYDEVFPLNQQMIQFVEQQFNNKVGGLTMIDAGCGTGSLAIALGRHNVAVNAFDLNEKMIKKAEEKRPQALNVSFRQGSLLNLQTLYPNHRADAVMCMGNTLVHLPYQEAVENFFTQAASMLKEGGNLIVQIVNYDNILKNKPQALPLIETENYHFERLYEYPSENQVRFTTRLTDKKDKGKVLIQHNFLLPCTKSFLEKALKSHFKSVKFFGSFDGAPWTKTSFHTIAVAHK